MTRSYEAFREEIDWHQLGILDQQYQDGLDAGEEEPPVSIPEPPKAKKSKAYNAFDTMSEEDIENFKIRERQ